LNEQTEDLAALRGAIQRLVRAERAVESIDFEEVGYDQFEHDRWQQAELADRAAKVALDAELAAVEARIERLEAAKNFVVVLDAVIIAPIATHVVVSLVALVDHLDAAEDVIAHNDWSGRHGDELDEAVGRLTRTTEELRASLAERESPDADH
jgi:hypothetical protein